MTIVRENRLGMRFNVETHCKDRNIVTVALQGTDKSVDVKLSLDDFSQRWYNWQMQGMNIADEKAFGNVIPAVREFFISGITPADWDAIFAETDDEERTKEKTSVEAYEEYLKGPLDPRD